MVAESRIELPPVGHEPTELPLLHSAISSAGFEPAHHLAHRALRARLKMNNEEEYAAHFVIIIARKKLYETVQFFEFQIIDAIFAIMYFTLF